MPVATAAKPAAAEQIAREEPLVEREAPAWLVSLVLHLVLLLVLALLTSPYGRSMTTMVLEAGQAADQGEDLQSFELDMTGPELSEAFENDPVDITDTVVEMPQERLTPDSLIEAVAPVQVDLTSLTIPTAGMMSGRSGTTKEALLAAFGGTQETEAAVQLGLKWLKKQQQPNGEWSLSGPYSHGSLSENRVAATAMAMLAFQGNGNTHQSGEYRDAVKQATEWMVRQQGRNGAFGQASLRSRRGNGLQGGFPDHHQMYSQAQATIAICELYAMTGDSWLRAPAQRALDFAVESQHALGGWRYKPREAGDTSVTGWFVMALESGRAADLDVSDDALRKVGYFLDSVQHYNGAAYGYQPSSSPSRAMTAEGMLCRQYLGWQRESPEMIRCVNSLVEDYNFDIDDQEFYYWYYATQVLHHFGGSPWRDWNGIMRQQLPADQVVAGPEAGSWAPQKSRWGSQAGRLYTTCMAIYCLEVYYRHMPLYEPKL